MFGCLPTNVCSICCGHIQIPLGGAVKGGSKQSKWKYDGQKSHSIKGATRQDLRHSAHFLVGNRTNPFGSFS